jgi:hypothetical protein
MTTETTSSDNAPGGISALAGMFADDPTLREICEEIYRERDADRAPELPQAVN